MGLLKVKDVEASARRILLDTYENEYRFEPLEMHEALRDALKHIRNIRPESQYVNGLLVDLNFPTLSNTDDTGTGTSLNMEDRWYEAVVYYIVHRMYMKDDPDTQNAGLSDKYLTMFNTSVAT